MVQEVIQQQGAHRIAIVIHDRPEVPIHQAIVAHRAVLLRNHPAILLLPEALQVIVAPAGQVIAARAAPAIAAPAGQAIVVLVGPVIAVPVGQVIAGEAGLLHQVQEEEVEDKRVYLFLTYELLSFL